MSLGGKRTTKLWYWQMMKYYSVLKRNKLSSHVKTWRRLQCKLLSERSPSEKATYCVIPTTCHSGKGKTPRMVKVQWWPGVGKEGRMNRQGTEDVRAVKTLCDTTVVDTHHYPFVQTQRKHTRKSDPDVHYGLQVMTCVS